MLDTGNGCILRNGQTATIRYEPSYDNPSYPFKVVLADGNYWSVTDEGYVWASKSKHDFDVVEVLGNVDDGHQNLLLTESNVPVKKNRVKTKKIAYFDFTDNELHFASKVPVDRMIQVIGYDVSERETTLLNRLISAIDIC